HKAIMQQKLSKAPGIDSSMTVEAIRKGGETMRSAILQILTHYGVPEKMIAAIKALYVDTESCVAVGGIVSNPFKVKTGVLQGDILAPFLFIIMVDYIFTNMKMQNSFETKANNYALKDLEFADNVLLFNNDVDLAREHLNELSETAAKVGLKINPTKTKFMTNLADGDLTHGPDIIECVDNFHYLGANLSSTEYDIKEHQKRRLAILAMMWKLWRSTDISVALKQRLYNATYKTVFIYGFEARTLSTKKVQTTQAKRKIMWIKFYDRVPNSTIYQMTNIIPLVDELQMQQLK
uniref:ribonuclease H n=1 Tax=Latimeria chalumnae TaxID=7897 RepID=H3A099_LATCH